MIGVYNHLLRKVFRFHCHSQKVIGSLRACFKEEAYGKPKEHEIDKSYSMSYDMKYGSVLFYSSHPKDTTCFSSAKNPFMSTFGAP